MKHEHKSWQGHDTKYVVLVHTCDGDAPTSDVMLIPKWLLDTLSYRGVQ